MSFSQADTLQYYLMGLTGVQKVKVQNRTCDAIIEYDGDRGEILKELQRFSYQQTEVPADYLKNSGREMNQYYWDKLVNRVILHYGTKLFLPISVRDVIATVKSVKYVCEGVRTLLKGMIEVPVLDGTAIGVSVFRGDYSTASSVMFLLGIGEILEEWTHKKSVEDLARSMSLNISKVWLIREGKEELTELTAVNSGDRVVVHMGNVIPFDGDVVAGEAMVNQASLTGESNPVRKIEGGYAYAGTVVEEGEITICVKEVNGSSKYEKIMTMIEDSEKLKSSLEGRAAHLADRLVPYTFAGTGLVWLLTRNTTKALSVLMVDFSCALKLAMPISVLSAIREANMYDITVKGGKYLEALANADTIVFDKTGTLTHATPTVVQVVPFGTRTEDEVLQIAACLEEHYPHSMANAVVQAAAAKGIRHDEMHSEVQYVVAHGIASQIGGEKAVIGSQHFVFEDEGCYIPTNECGKFDALPPEYSHLYLAIGGVLAGVICIADPLREEASEVLKQLRGLGIRKAVMMTGDNDRTASVIAKQVGVDRYYAEVLPEDKANFVEQEKAAGHTVIMLGDGINDSPALSAADVGIAISDGAAIAREIADVTIAADSLRELVLLKSIANGLQKRTESNYRFIMSFNSTLIVLGAMGILPPATSALLHNASTLGVSLKSMTNLLD